MGFLVVVAVLAVGGVVALLALLPSQQVPPPSTEPEDLPQRAPPVELPVSPMVPERIPDHPTGVGASSFTRPSLELKPKAIPVPLLEEEPKPFVFDEYEYDYTYASPERRWQFCVVETTRYGDPRRPRMMLVDATTGEQRYTKGIKEAPEEAFVTDAGVVVLYDSGSGVDRFTALDAEAKRLWSKSFRNGVFEHMISADHRRLVVVECENDDSSVRKTSVLDVESGNRICGIDLPEDGDLVFDGNQLNIEFVGRERVGRVSFPVGEAGEIPEEFWDAVGKEHGFARFIEPKIDAALSKSPPRKKEALRLLDQLEKKGNTEDRAMALSFRGDLALEEGQDQQALTYWEEALALDPNSVQRGRVRDLRRKLAKASEPARTNAAPGKKSRGNTKT